MTLFNIAELVLLYRLAEALLLSEKLWDNTGPGSIAALTPGVMTTGGLADAWMELTMRTTESSCPQVPPRPQGKRAELLSSLPLSRAVASGGAHLGVNPTSAPQRTWKLVLQWSHFPACCQD